MGIARDRVAAGSELAGYRIVALVGRGGMGEVYRAHDERLERDVALKVLGPRFGEDGEFRSRLERESRLAASLDHPNVIPVYGAGEADGRLYLAMRFVDGTDLRALLRREGPLEPPRTVEIAAQVADALDAAHLRGLVHRDVKPSNVLIADPGGREHCYLADFGLTQSLSDRGAPADGHLLGTLDYVAPEQVRGDDVDGRADVYGLACLLHECLTGEVPFPRGSEVATIYAHLQDEPPVPSERRPSLPVALDDALRRGLAKDPDERQPTASALVAEVREALGLVPAPSSRRRWAAALAAATLAALAAVAVAAVLAMRGGAPATTAGSLVRIDPASGEVRSTVAVPGHPGNLVVTPGGVWIADFRDGVLWRHEPRTGELQRITSAGEPRDLAVLGSNVYVAADGPKLFEGNVSRYDARTGVRENAVDLVACAIAAGDGVVWAAGCPSVQRLSTDARPFRILRERFLPFATPLSAETRRVQFRELAVGAGSLWVLGDALDRRLWRLDARMGVPQATVPLGFPPRTVAVGEGSVWITDSLDDALVRLDPKTNRVLGRIPVGRGASGVAVGAGSVWVTNALDGTVSQIDPRTLQVVDTIEVGGVPREVAAGGGSVWVTAHAR